MKTSAIQTNSQHLHHETSASSKRVNSPAIPAPDWRGRHSFHMIITALLLMFLSVFVQAQVFHGTLTQSSQSAVHPFTTGENGDVFITIVTGPNLNLDIYNGFTVFDSDGVSSLYKTHQGSGQTICTPNTQSSGRKLFSQVDQRRPEFLLW